MTISYLQMHIKVYILPQTQIFRMFLLVPLVLLVRVSASFDSFRAFWLCWPFVGAFEEWHVATFQRQTATAVALFRVLMGLINIMIINMLIIVIAEPNSISSFIAQKSYSMAIFFLCVFLFASPPLSFFHLFNSIMFFFFGYYVAFTSSLCSLVMITSYFFSSFLYLHPRCFSPFILFREHSNESNRFGF